MRVMVAGVALLFIVVTSPSFAQTAHSDSQTLDAILAELREIHHELRSTQAMQTLLAELGAKQSVVNQAVERLDRERSNLIQIQSDQGRTLGELDRAQDKVDHSSDPTEQKQLTEEVQRLKTNISTLKILEQTRQSAVDEAQQRLRDSQDALQEVQEQLDAMTKNLTQGEH
jgi:predicted translin family RNA/ssDNA-binding protein